MVVWACVCALLPASPSQEVLDSPFGWHPARAEDPLYPDSGYHDALNIGVDWTRDAFYSYWHQVQTNLSVPTLDFSQLDIQLSKIPTNLCVLANIAPQGPDDEGRCVEGTWIPVNETQYLAFVTATIERYDGDGVGDMPDLENPIRHWQIGNEPNDAYQSDFAYLQEITYDAIKLADPGATVLIGGVPGSPEGYIQAFDYRFAPILEELGGSHIDVFDFHWYGRAFGHYRIVDESAGENVLNHIRSTLVANGFPVDMPIWITEMGTYSGDPIDDTFELPYQSEREQAMDFVKRHIHPLSIGVGKVFPAWGMMEGFQLDNGYFDHTGVIYDGRGPDDPGVGVKKLAYYTYKKMTELLDGTDWSTLTNLHDGTESDHVYLYRCEQDGNPVYIAWWDYFDEPGYQEGDTHAFEMTGLQDSCHLVRCLVPSVQTGQLVTNYATAFSVTNGMAIGGSMTIQLGKDPVVVYADAVPPEVVSTKIRNETTINIVFSEQLNRAHVCDPSHFSVNNGVEVYAATLDTDLQSVNLTVSPMELEQIYSIHITGIKDLAGNVIAEDTHVYTPYFEACLAFDSFELEGVGVLAGQGGEINGWADVWTNGTIVEVSAPPMEMVYEHPSGISSRGRGLAAYAPSGSTTSRTSREIGMSLGYKTTYISFLTYVDGSLGMNDHFFVGASASPSSAMAVSGGVGTRTPWNEDENFFHGMAQATEWVGPSQNTGTTYMVVLKMEGNGSNQWLRSHMFVNPTDPEHEVAEFTNTIEAVYPADVKHINLMIYGEDIPDVYIDELRLGPSWRSVVKCNHLPKLQITNPFHEFEFLEHELIPFAGVAFDARGITSLTNMSWHSDLQGLFAEGPSVYYDSLQAGQHTITLKAFDPQNVEGSTGIGVTILADADENGLPDVWEDIYWPEEDSGGSGSDYDEDGYSNYDEWVAGSDPTKKHSVFSVDDVTIATGTESVEITWQAIAKRQYSVFWAADLGDEFSLLSGGIIPSQSGTFVFSDTEHTAFPVGFYRVTVRR